MGILKVKLMRRSWIKPSTTKMKLASLVFLMTLSSWIGMAGAQAQCASEDERVRIPGGVFKIGEQFGYPEERPVRDVVVEPFEIDRTEVTNRRFAEFVDATGYVTDAERKPNLVDATDDKENAIEPGSAVFISPIESGQRQWWQYVLGAYWRAPEGPGSSIQTRMDHPVVHISYNDALAFAEWVGGDLPTEAEWEIAARGGLVGMRYEWGSADPKDGPARANTWQGVFPFENKADDGHVGTAPVGSYPANGYGLCDMTGNVWEWSKGRFDLEDENSGVIRGGSHLCAENFCRRYRPASRQPHERDFSTSHIGFRLVYRDE